MNLRQISISAVARPFTERQDKIDESSPALNFVPLQKSSHTLSNAVLPRIFGPSFQISRH